MDKITFWNWVPIRDALQAAYDRLGLSMEDYGSGRKYNETHWNIAGLVYEKAKADFIKTSGSCITCKTELDYHTVIRCLDCKSQLCEYCAKEHFGPNHSIRSNSAHGN